MSGRVADAISASIFKAARDGIRRCSIRNLPTNDPHHHRQGPRATRGQPRGWGALKPPDLRVAGRRPRHGIPSCARSARQACVGEDVSWLCFGDTAAQQRPRKPAVSNRRPKSWCGISGRWISGASQSDATVDPDWLNRARLVVLPYNPVLTPETEATLLRYLDQGGKLLAFYFLPERLNTALHLKSIRHVKASPPGQFAMMRFNPGALPGAPREVRQRSWNIYSVEPWRARAGCWRNGTMTRPAHRIRAVLGSTNGLVMTHILLADDAAINNGCCWRWPARCRRRSDAGRPAAIERIGTTPVSNYDDASGRLAA